MKHQTRTKILRQPPSFGGLVIALVFWWASLTPSLLPRPWYLQAVISGLALAFGYGLGVVSSQLFRTIGRIFRLPAIPFRWRRVAWYVLGIASIALGGIALMLSEDHQKQLRSLLNLPPDYAFRMVYLVIAALALGFGLVVLARLVRWLGQSIKRPLNRFLPDLLADIVTILVLVALLLGIVGNSLYHYAYTKANAAFRYRDSGTKAGTVPPTSPSRSGSPASLASWDSLGKQGREFVAKGPTVSQLMAFSHHAATSPIRVYAGLKSAPDLQARANLVEKELERTGAYNRAVLAVAATTGTGWVDPDAPNALEYMYAGNSAVAALQYSYLPSWISFLADRDIAAQAAQTLIDTIHAHWQQLPADTRPKLLIFGESLGAYGSQTVFKNPSELTTLADGILWVGPPNASQLWQYLNNHRDIGSPLWRPIYQHSQTVRFITKPADLAALPAAWAPPRVLFLQHASDPVVWMNTQLLYKQPAWLKQPRGTDVSSNVRWYPFVSWAQMAIDLAVAGNVPDGHGHVYNGDIIDSLAAVLPPAHWTASDTNHLHQALHE